MFDIGLFGAAGIGALYLIESEKKCLIDCGISSLAPNIVKTLHQMDAFPPDIIILTHSHWDHVQGVPYLRREASKIQKNIEIMASEKAIPHLTDQSFNVVLNEKAQFESITDVTPLHEDDVIDLGGITLRIIDVPGHTDDHIALLDEKNKNIFLGDSIGIKIADNTLVPPFLPPFWNENAFRSTIEKLRQIDYNSACLAHFGYIYEDESKTILDESLLACEAWWNLLETIENEGRLDDVKYVTETFLAKTGIDTPHIELVDTKLKLGLKLLNGWRRLRGKERLLAAEFLMNEVADWLVKSYKMTKQ
jgi:glyoxylase-like metal-dependent hydrolase (beta-lactamase superfamily II)